MAKYLFSHFLTAWYKRYKDVPVVENEAVYFNSGFIVKGESPYLEAEVKEFVKGQPTLFRNTTNFTK